MIGGQGVVQAEGTYEFNEYLALSYARDRHSQRILSDGSIVYNDRGRNERQREVIKAAWEKVKTKPLALIPPSVFMAMTYVETDMSSALIINLLRAMMEINAQILDMSVPNPTGPHGRRQTAPCTATTNFKTYTIRKKLPMKRRTSRRNPQDQKAGNSRAVRNRCFSGI